MEELIQVIINRLLQRENQTLVVSGKEQFSCNQRTMKDFLYNKNILITDVSALFLKKVVEEDEENPWIPWIFSSFDYGCSVTFQLAFPYESLIPQKLLTSYPIAVVHKNGLRCHAFSKRMITYKDVAWMDQSTMLLLYGKQLLTAMAAEHLEKNQVIQVERG